MDMVIIFQPLPLLLFIIVFITSAYFLLNHRRSSTTKNLPPGGSRWPIIGETLEFLHKTPENFIKHKIQKYSSQVFMTNILGEPTAVFSGPAANKFIISNEHKLVKAWSPPSQRKLFRMSNSPAPAPAPKQSTSPSRPTGFLRPESRYVGLFDFLANKHLRRCLEGKEEAKVYHLAKAFTLTLACNYFMGMEDVGRAEKMVGKFDDLAMGIHSLSLNFPGTIFYRANKAVGELRREIEAIIMEKSVKMGDGVVMEDFLSQLIAGNQSGRKYMPPAKIVDTIIGLLTASYSSAATVITFMVKYTGERPDVYQKILSEQSEIYSKRGSDDELGWDHIHKMKYTWAVACETMRLVPPLQGAFREVLTDFDFAGFTISKGCKIYWALNMPNKNPEYFKDPEKFDPSRFEEENNGGVKSHNIQPYTFIPFGGGPKMCSGKEYARLVILTFIHNFVNKFKWQVLFPNEKILSSLIMPTPEQGLPVFLQPL
ncbi:hypothetical protein FNV43_RR06270 [Rhamnella rubrinervis]|uniref:Cytochrome P450 n=1 Tax=Rhamnella rubrinervis TaxID=2594499 RepID=A0A8K0HD79_9ROSA|nr:hypothetical protein FNV43_RR06270 [Rhamnella rubrinervis]